MKIINRNRFKAAIFIASFVTILALSTLSFAFTSKAEITVDDLLFNQRTPITPIDRMTTGVEFGDIDGDGDLDLIQLNHSEPKVLLYLNDGGNLAPDLNWQPALFENSDRPTDSALGDADGDGDLDLAITTWGGEELQTGVQPYFLFENIGGTFTNSPIELSNPNNRRHAKSVAWGDFDGDGDLDLIFGHGSNRSAAGQSEQNVIFENQSSAGNFAFSESWVSIDDAPTQEVDVVDIDGDNDLDILVANGFPDRRRPAFSISHQNKIYLNTKSTDGSGTFQFDELDLAQGTTDPSSAVTASDLDGDGKTEIIVANYDGEAAVYCTAIDPVAGLIITPCSDASSLTSPLPEALTSISVADINRDGLEDIALGSQRGQPRVLCADSSQWSSTAPAFSTCWDSTPFGNNLFTTDVAWGDLTNDGQLELAVGNGGIQRNDQPSFIYQNLRPNLDFPFFTNGTPFEQVSSAAAGDLDLDGDTDLVIGYNHHIVNGATRTTDLIDPLYLNDSSGTFTPLSAGISLTATVSSVAIADYDGDGDLDIAAGFDNDSTDLPAIAVFRNDTPWQAGIPPFTRVWEQALPISVTTDIDWGDVNGDGYLDLAVGALGERQNGSEPFAGAPNSIFTFNPTGSDHSSDRFESVWTSTGFRKTRGIKLADIDNDGDPDLVVGNDNQPNELYLNIGGDFSETPIWESDQFFDTNDVAVVDINQDGLLDLFFANGIKDNPQRSNLYLNNGGRFDGEADWSTEPAPASSIAVSDFDNDGDPDLAVSSSTIFDQNVPNRIFRNEGGTLTQEAQEWDIFVREFTRGWQVGDLLWVDVDNDGDDDLIDLFIGSLSIQNRIIPNDRYNDAALTPPPAISLELSSFYTTPQKPDGMVEIPYTLIGRTATEQFHILASYSLNNGSDWRTLTPTQPQSTPLQPGTVGANYVYRFDPIENGIFGLNKAARVRLVAVPYHYPEGASHPTGLYKNEKAGPFVFSSPAVTTPPFLIEGLTFTVQQGGEPVAGAMLYFCADVCDIESAARYEDGAGRPLVTNDKGHFPGQFGIDPNDEILILSPPEQVDFTRAARLHYTSGSPNETGIEFNTITPGGTVDINTNNKLYLFNLLVSVEWDASNDQVFLAQLDRNLRRSSEIFYDLTDGQMALGEVVVLLNKEGWRQSNIQVHASNRFRPSADLGGIVSRPVSVTLGTGPSTNSNTLAFESADSTIYGQTTITNAIVPGQIRMAATWNRFGEQGLEEGEDWARAFAHELGHYFLVLPDNYLLADPEKDFLVEVDNLACIHSVMSSAYAGTDEPGSEFLTPEIEENCDKVVAKSLTGLTDWEAITDIYDITGQDNPGPSRLPLDVTNVTIIPPSDPEQGLASELIFVRDRDSNRTESLSPQTVIAFLLRPGQYVADVVPLGEPIGNQILARGAKVGDELCVYDSQPGNVRSACSPITPAGAPDLYFDSLDWSAVARVIPPELPAGNVYSGSLPVTLTVEVDIQTSEPITSVSAQLFTNLISSTISYSSPELELTPIVIDDQDFARYMVEVPVDDIVVNGHLRIWLNGEKNSQTLTPFFLGGAWNPDAWLSGPDAWLSGPDAWLSGPDAWLSGPDAWLSGPDAWLSGPDAWLSGSVLNAGWNAPVLSGDGQLTLFNVCSIFDQSPQFTLETLSTVPNLPNWIVPIGTAYQVDISLDDGFEYEDCAVGDRAVNTLVFNYLTRDLPNRVYEDAIQIYRYDEATETWLPLNSTTQNTTQNLISGAYHPDSTLYLIGMSTEIALKPGWNLVGYPLRNPIDLENVLVGGLQESVWAIYGYSDDDEFLEYCADGVTIPDGIPMPNSNGNGNRVCKTNSSYTPLTHFEPGKGYWIYVAEEATLLFPVDQVNQVLTPLSTYIPIILR